jgi:gelsolin
MERLTSTELEKKLREESSQEEPAWKGCGTTEGLEIWRVENNKLASWPKEEYGNFFTGDSYIILHTEKNLSLNLFEYTIHAWTGDDTSKDEVAIASYKVIELDDYLGREAQIFSEKENEESETFLSYFKTFTIMKGGIDSEFKDSDVKGYHPKLFHVHGKGNTVHSHEYPISEKYMNSKDVFVLDAGLRIYDWRGKTSTGFEKLQATILVKKLWEKRNQKPQLFTIEQGEESEEFKEYFIKAKEEIKDESLLPPLYQEQVVVQKKLMKLSEDDGKISFDEIEYKKENLNSKDAFIIDIGNTLYVWIGKNASKIEKRFAVVYAKRYLAQNPSHKDCSFVIAQEGKLQGTIDKCFE